MPRRSTDEVLEHQQISEVYSIISKDTIELNNPQKRGNKIVDT